MADKYLNLTGIKKLYNDLRARLLEKMNNPVNEGTENQVLTKTVNGYEWKEVSGTVSGLESTKARTVTAMDAKPQYQAYWNHATTYSNTNPIDVNWSLKNIATSLVNPIITASCFANNKLVVGITDNTNSELWISENKGNTFSKSKFNFSKVCRINCIEYSSNTWFVAASKTLETGDIIGDVYTLII